MTDHDSLRMKIQCECPSRNTQFYSPFTVIKLLVLPVVIIHLLLETHNRISPSEMNSCLSLSFYARVNGTL